jgi:hypothetical protein
MRAHRPQKMKSHRQIGLSFNKKGALWTTSSSSPVRVNKARTQSDSSFKLKTILKTMYMYFVMFLETSSIHGLNHLVSKKRDISER